MAESSTLKQMNMSEPEIQRRLKIVGFGPADAKRVVSLDDVLHAHSEELATGFFEHLSAVDDTSRLTKDRAVLENARRLKLEHLRALTKGHYGPAYVEERLKLGSIYATAGLDPRNFLGAFHHLMAAIGRRVMEKFKNNAGEGFENFLSLQKIAFFDLGIIIDTIVYERERIIRQQQEAIRELSTPVMQLRDRMLILPIIGVVDTQRAKQLTEDLLQAIRTHRAKVIVMDITGVPIVDSKVANHLVQTVQAAKLMGAVTVVTGLSAQVAQALVTLGADLGKLNTIGDLQGGVEEAERILGYRLLMNGAAGSPPSNGSH